MKHALKEHTHKTTEKWTQSYLLCLPSIPVKGPRSQLHSLWPCKRKPVGASLCGRANENPKAPQSDVPFFLKVYAHTNLL